MLAVFLSTFKHDYWIFKALEYPRLQKLLIAVMLMGAWIIWWPPAWGYRSVAIGLGLAIIFLLVKIWPYTFFYSKEVRKISGVDTSQQLTLFAATVLQDNRAYDRLLAQIKTSSPDIIFLLETDAGWAAAMAVLKADYPHHILQPQNNTYGLLFYSRLPIEDAQLRYLVKDDIPSVKLVLRLPNGKQVQLWGLHPEPPAPQEALYSTAADKELVKVAFEARDTELPAIVVGDLNDVAWSHVTELFRKTSGLLDPRRGRGFYATFSAHYLLLRYPLDYVFCSRHFGLVSMQRLGKNGSDHFPTLTRLAFLPDGEQEDTGPEATADELEEAAEIASQPVKEVEK